jgi:hypothetical protein
LYGKATGAETDNESGHETASRNDDVEEVPTVCTEAPPTKAKKTNESINNINECEKEEKIVCGMVRQKIRGNM